MWAHCTWSCSSINITPICYHVTIGLGKQAKGIWPIMIGKMIYRLIVCTLVIHSRIHLQSTLVHTNLRWQRQANARQWFMGLKLCWIYIQSRWYYKWMFGTHLI
jgi:hypothetical protein